jgi:hypothetical protein
VLELEVTKLSLQSLIGQHVHTADIFHERYISITLKNVIYHQSEDLCWWVGGQSHLVTLRNHTKILARLDAWEQGL